MECADSWIAYHDHCYQITGELNSWFDASETCARRGASLACVNSAAENEFLVGLLQTDDDGGIRNGWIGYHDSVTEGRFEWLEPCESTYENWAPTQPNHRTEGEDCVSLWLQDLWDGPPGSWLDIECSQRRPFFCEGDSESSGFAADKKEQIKNEKRGEVYVIIAGALLISSCLVLYMCMHHLLRKRPRTFRNIEVMASPSAVENDGVVEGYLLPADSDVVVLGTATHVDAPSVLVIEVQRPSPLGLAGVD